LGFPVPEVMAGNAQIIPDFFIQVKAKSLRDFTELLPRNDNFLGRATFVHHYFLSKFKHGFNLVFLRKTASKNRFLNLKI